jgi:hypothetical protein
MTPFSTCVFHLPSIPAWVSAVVVHGGTSACLGIPIGAILYATPWRRPLGLFFGIGTAVLMAWLPFGNREHPWMSTFLASFFGFATFFKSIAVAFDQQPPEANDSIVNFVHWFVAVPEPVFAKGKPRRTTPYEILARAKYFFYKICGLFVILSLFHATKVREEALLLRGFLHVWFIYLWAAFCMDFGALANTTLSGISSQEGFRNPLLESRSIREAWSARWNLPVHIFLKRSVYIPARKAGYGRAMASVVTFFASGLLHEYNFSIHNASAYEPGKATLFFVAMGCVVLVEDWWLSKVCAPYMPSWISRVPSPLISSFLVLIVAAGPVEPLFVKSWLEAGVVEAVSELLPHVTCGE